MINKGRQEAQVKGKTENGSKKNVEFWGGKLGEWDKTEK